MDTACVYLGPNTTLKGTDRQPENVLQAGGRGSEFGMAYELRDKGKPVAIALFGFIDNDFGTKESVWHYLKSTFGISE